MPPLWPAFQRPPIPSLGNTVENKLHLQAEWLPVVGEIVEIRLNNKPVRRGRVDSVTPDGQILWLAADGAEPRSMFERLQHYSVWIEYKWETSSAGGVAPRSSAM